MPHPFGDLLKRYLSRKYGLSQSKLAEAVYVDPAVITRMCQGKGLNRDRILEIIVWFQKEAVFESVAEANALLQAAGLAELNSDEPREMEIRRKLEQETLRLLGSQKPVPNHKSLTGRKQGSVWWGIGVMAILTLLGAFFIWRVTQPTPSLWQENFNPLDGSKWAQVSARWDDLPGSAARLIESNPEEVFGKVESEIITANMDSYPFLRIGVTALDLNSSYTVQILDKRTAITKDVLKSIVVPGVQRVNLAQEMGWEGTGVQSFTINIWIGGEGKSVTFVLVKIGKD
jgi:plasmid maintenance system antidote protein VapI